MSIRRLFTASKMAMVPPRRISTAAMLVIGDEILNGKIQDTNSRYFAQYCFGLGIDLRRVSVVPDVTADIVDTLNYLRKKYDFIITTGGIGPTHDDITYESIAQAFELPLKLNDETVKKMNVLSRHPPKDLPPQSPVLEAQLRMAKFPYGENVDVHFVSPDLWVPVVSLDSQVFIFPGIPSLFEKMLECLKPQIVERADSPKLLRKYVSTTSSESSMAFLLTNIQNEYGAAGVKIGSYPHFNDQTNTVSIIGPDADALEAIVSKVKASLDNAHEVSSEQENLSS